LQIEFQSARRHLVIDRIQRVSDGKQRRYFVNKWVKVEYMNGTTPRVAFFADGGALGWSGVLGGTDRIFEAVKQIPTVSEDEQSKVNHAS
jgi:hypothetical protein